MKNQIIGRLCVGLAAVLFTSGADAAGTTVLYNDQIIAIDEVLSSPTDLWVSPEDLTRINGFVLKPEGACLEELCIPISQSEDSDLFVRRDGKGWINVTELARMVQQPFLSDTDAAVWSFGAIPLVRRPFLESAIAPDFALTDRKGKVVRLSDFRGKKVLIMTWASW